MNLEYEKLRNVAMYFFAISFLLIFVAFIVVLALEHGTNMDTYATNGTFQIYNPLRRLNLGQQLGTDFPFFHGIGIPILHFPLFKLLGSNVFAAEISKWLVGAILFLLSTFLVSKNFLKSSKDAIISTALCSAICLYMLASAVFPSNSLLSVRSIFPFIVAAALLYNNDKTWKISFIFLKLKDVLIASSLALAVLMGTEQGSASILSFFVVFLIFSVKWKTNFFKQIITLLSWFFGIAFSLMLFAAIFSGFHPVEVLRYAFIDVPHDQFWYFGVPPNNYATLDNIVPTFQLRYLSFLTIPLVTTFVLMPILWYKKLISINQVRVILFLFLYGLISMVTSSLGYFAPDSQSIPLAKAMIVTSSLLITVAVSIDKKYITVPVWKGINIFVSVCVVIFLTFNAFNIVSKKLLVSHPRHLLESARVARHEGDYYSASYGWKASLDSFSTVIDSKKSLWSFYTNVYDSTNGKLNPSSTGADYIIHALGEKRKIYEKEFIEQYPDQVITMRPSYFVYEDWLKNSHWKIYEALITKYLFVKENASHLLWVKNDTAIPKISPDLTLNANEKGWYIAPVNNSDKTKIYTGTVRYKAQSGLPNDMLSNLPRYFVTVGNNTKIYTPVSLPSDEQTWTFPVIIPPGSTATISSNVNGLIKSANLQIQGIVIRELDVPDINIEYYIKTW